MNIETTLPTQSYLSFKVGQEVFASNVEKVLEILEVPKITKVPKTPPFMRGVINLRGSVLAVIDTRLKFDMPPVADTVNTCIMVLNIQMEAETLMLGALVNAVQEVFEISQSQIKPAPSIGSNYKAEFVDGMFKIQDQFIILLKLEKVFSSEQVISMKHSPTNVHV